MTRNFAATLIRALIGSSILLETCIAPLAAQATNHLSSNLSTESLLPLGLEGPSIKLDCVYAPGHRRPRQSTRKKRSSRY